MFPLQPGLLFRAVTAAGPAVGDPLLAGHFKVLPRLDAGRTGRHQQLLLRPLARWHLDRDANAAGHHFRLLLLLLQQRRRDLGRSVLVGGDRNQAVFLPDRAFQAAEEPKDSV